MAFFLTVLCVFEMDALNDQLRAAPFYRNTLRYLASQFHAQCCVKADRQPKNTVASDVLFKKEFSRKVCAGVESLAYSERDSNSWTVMRKAMTGDLFTICRVDTQKKRPDGQVLLAYATMYANGHLGTQFRS